MKPLSRRLRSFAVVAAVAGLVLNAATPLLAWAAAASRGVSPDTICDVYGVPGRLVVAHPAHRARPAPAIPMHDAAMHDPAMPDADTVGSHDTMSSDDAMDHSSAASADVSSGGVDVVVATGDAPADQSEHAPGHAHGDHCALAALATLAPPMGATPAPPPVVVEAGPVSVARRDAAPFDAAAFWTARLNRGPPTIA